MDASMIKDPNKEANMKLNRPSINSHSPTFLVHKGFVSSDQVSDIEMIKIQSVSYISLKDLLSSPRTLQPRISSPTTRDDDCCCWSEGILIKNPLVKQAALAYLQPMSNPTAAVEKGSFGGLEGRRRHESGCLFWLYDVVWRNVKAAVWESRKVVYE